MKALPQPMSHGDEKTKVLHHISRGFYQDWLERAARGFTPWLVPG